jgi:nucleoid-associated protein YgaU
MKKTVLAFLVLLLAAAAVQAQNLSDNEFYLKSVDLRGAAQRAFDEGEYDLAAELAGEAKDYARRSDEYVARMLAMRAARNAVDAAQARYDWAAGVRAETRFPDDYAGATTELAAAKAALEAELFDEAMVHARAVVAYLSKVSSDEALPAFFVVRELSEKHDCFWRIAGLPFVYNDPFQWPTLYRANKNSLPNPDNPDLILPGMTLTIPPLSGELREGVWNKDATYPVFKDTRK